MRESFRRHGPLISVCVLLGVVVLVALGTRSSAIAFFGGVACLYGFVYGVSEAVRRLDIAPDSISQSGSFGGPQVVHSGAVYACSYRAVVPLGRAGFRLHLLQIVGADGQTVVVSKGGWGRQRARLFAELSTWLARSGVPLGPRESAFLSP
jgi:hypothetical protein